MADVAFLGYGRMAQAISAGLNRANLAPYAKQAAADIASGPLTELGARLGLTVSKSNSGLFDLSDTVIIAVKPHQVRDVLSEVSPCVKNHLVISIAAGVKLSTLQSLLPPSTSIIRVIPNLPALVGKGVTLMCAGTSIDRQLLERAKKIFESVGSVFELDERLFDTGTAVSGSGPAFLFLVMEAMIRGAVRLGLPWDLAREMVLKTAQGSAATALEHFELSLASLRDQVTSPGGTTAEGLLELEEGSLTALFHRALEAAAEKGRQLA
ncbi:MAG: pyrroline-5-carboxylate reductase [Deltaproteobacteria bacterium]|jgi:pyrroline-5-carboxylate reductase|nr:pyrroline-5-carboxylate reductase [Deltaproteobacteria bacterium]